MVELRGLELRLGHRGLGAQILQLLEADDLVGVQVLAALQVARRLLGHLPRLLDLRVDFGQLDFRERAAPA